MLGIIDRRKRTEVVEQTVSVSGTRELNRHSVQTKHQKCKSYLVARVS